MVVDIKSALVVDGVGPMCTQILNTHGIKVTNIPKITKEELLREIPVSRKYNMVVDIKSALVVDGVGPMCTQILNTHGIKVTNIPKITKEELLREIPLFFAVLPVLTQ
ncbi:D-3-phosphoglycerate dehydrogenase [Operophtera brumata]|uniref:D-3-phosphoglycerate dehydrogenase n=1 Tax=Operophtera brumata TaxID=104452 RepID=A0A0L7LDS7_OPEBR|nr:D-3-phosphoglycerate dehydrogenase [Operophtera brumata]